ncbi:MAG TPA: methyltransferase domain-containing protein [Chitinophagaceae bacterium]|nr:methyltransferase domain-containing protein [Chitinophagaceae bacterium]
MKRITLLRLCVPCLCLCLLCVSLFAQSRYETKGGDPNGINKWYMGRQIAYVMSHQGIDWLERPERELEENSSQLLKNMNIKPGMVIADIGAGSGYYTVRLSKLAGSGKVYAVDVEPEMIKYLDQRITKDKLTNVITILGTEKDVHLPASSINLMLLVDVYHEFAFPYEMGRSMLDALKPGGVLYLVEFRAEDPKVPIKAVHKMSEKQAVKELEAAGFQFVRNITNLPWQHCMVFRKN